MAELLEQMMTQLMSKEVLYDPIKELSEKVCPSNFDYVLGHLILRPVVPSVSTGVRFINNGGRSKTIRRADLDRKSGSRGL
jgi:hypothetical protein